MSMHKIKREARTGPGGGYRVTVTIDLDNLLLELLDEPAVVRKVLAPVMDDLVATCKAAALGEDDPPDPTPEA